MAEHIRYALGESSLGTLLAARSEHGLVAFAFSDERDENIKHLQERFPGAVISEDCDLLRETMMALSALVDHPGRQLEIPLDIRGTDYQKRVWALLRQIPPGTTTYYGDRCSAWRARCSQRDRGDCQQPDRDPDPVPPRGEEGRVPFRLSWRRAAQTCIADAGATGERVRTMLRIAGLAGGGLDAHVEPRHPVAEGNDDDQRLRSACRGTGK